MPCRSQWSVGHRLCILAMWQKRSCDVWWCDPWLEGDQSGLQHRHYGHDPAIRCRVSDADISCESSQVSWHLQHAQSMSLLHAEGWREQVPCMSGSWWSVISAGLTISSTRMPSQTRQGQYVSWCVIGTDLLTAGHLTSTQNPPRIPPGYCLWRCQQVIGLLYDYLLG